MLDRRRLGLLKEGFDNVGVSVDVDRDITLARLSIKINNGTEKLTPEIIEREGYLPDSFVPKQTWRDLTPDESRQLLAKIDAIDSWDLGIQQHP